MAEDLNPPDTELSLDDTGTRYVHYQELLSEWRNALLLLEERVNDFSTASTYAEKIVQLQLSVKTMETQLDVMSGYNEDGQLRLSKLINNEAPPKKWKGESAADKGWGWT